MKVPFVLEGAKYCGEGVVRIYGRASGVYNMRFLSGPFFLVNNADLNENSVKSVIFNDPATIIFWNDGTKTVVKCCGEAFDPEKGLAMAIAKKALGNEGNYYNVFRKFLPKSNLIIRNAFDENMRLLREALLGL